MRIMNHLKLFALIWTNTLEFCQNEMLFAEIEFMQKRVSFVSCSYYFCFSLSLSVAVVDSAHFFYFFFMKDCF